MSEHHHSLKRETSHETNPLLYEVLTKLALSKQASKHCPQRQSKATGEGGKGVKKDLGGRHPSLYKVKQNKGEVQL